MDDLISWLHNTGRVGVFDATNTTKERRQVLLNRLRPEGFSVIFIESICDSPEVIANNVREVKTSSPDYVGVDPERAMQDFMARIEHYRQAYQPLDDTDNNLRYIKVFDVGQKVVANRISSYLGGRILFYLLNLHTVPRKIYLTRHGQSLFNLEQRIGGDPELTPAGELYAHRLSQWVTKNVGLDTGLTVWTSTLQRSIGTGKYIPAPKVSLRALDEIDAGICDGMSYEEVERAFPDEFAHRAVNKLGYRYPRGESYIDVIQRLEPVIFELERQRNPVIVIGHQAVLRCLYAYFLEKDASECPYLPIPIHTVIEIEPKAYGCVERQFPLVSPTELKEANRVFVSPPTPHTPSSPLLGPASLLMDANISMGTSDSPQQSEAGHPDPGATSSEPPASPDIDLSGFNSSYS
jgi:broad specificity phosphatase PhoE